MRNENDFTIRVLTKEDAEEYNALLRYSFQVTEQELAETGWKDVMKKLMKKSLTRMKESNKSFALLYPYSIPLYRRLGWEIISNKMTYVIKDTQVPQKISEPGYVRRVEWDDQDFKALHGMFAAKTHGCLYRNKLAWEEYFRWDEDDTMVAIYYSAKDVPIGYMVYLISSDIMHIKEMIYLNREAQLGLWEYIHKHDSMIDEVRGNNYYR